MPYVPHRYNAHRDLAEHWLGEALRHALRHPRAARACLKRAALHCNAACGAPDLAMRVRELAATIHTTI